MGRFKTTEIPADLRERVLDRLAQRVVATRTDRGWKLDGVYVRALAGPLPFAVVADDGTMYALFLSAGDALHYGLEIAATGHLGPGALP